jgi:hypothetical protein
MPQKPKARKGSSKTKGKSRSKSASPEKTQSERFIEAARNIGVDESGAEFERALAKVAGVRVSSKSRDRRSS